MEWNHLPVAGGLYDQHPQLLSDWEVIGRIDAEAQEARMEKSKREANRKGATPTRRGRRR
jgi:hypothetical protein